MSLREWFGTKEEPWWKLATRQPIEVFDQDTGEVHELKAGQSDPGEIEGLLIDFRYVDAQGVATRRSILCWHCWRENDALYVCGYCPFREDLRTFRVDRMRAVIETRPGRAIPDAELHRYFAPFAKPDEPKAAPGFTDFNPNDIARHIRTEWQALTPEEIEADALRRHIVHRARRDCIAGLRVLAYIALADDARTEEERNVEISYIESRLAMCSYRHDPALTEALMDVSRALAVPPGSFTRAIKEIVMDRAHFDLVLASAELLTDIDGTLDNIETKAIGTLRQAGVKAGWL